jgi:hypothetical protein
LTAEGAENCREGRGENQIREKLLTAKDAENIRKVRKEIRQEKQKLWRACSN